MKLLTALAITLSVSSPAAFADDEPTGERIRECTELAAEMLEIGFLNDSNLGEFLYYCDHN